MTPKQPKQPTQLPITPKRSPRIDKQDVVSLIRNASQTQINELFGEHPQLFAISEDNKRLYKWQYNHEILEWGVSMIGLTTYAFIDKCNTKQRSTSPHIMFTPPYSLLVTDADNNPRLIFSDNDLDRVRSSYDTMADLMLDVNRDTCVVDVHNQTIPRTWTPPQIYAVIAMEEEGERILLSTYDKQEAITFARGVWITQHRIEAGAEVTVVSPLDNNNFSGERSVLQEGDNPSQL